MGIAKQQGGLLLAERRDGLGATRPSIQLMRLDLTATSELLSGIPDMARAKGAEIGATRESPGRNKKPRR